MVNGDKVKVDLNKENFHVPVFTLLKIFLYFFILGINGNFYRDFYFFWIVDENGHYHKLITIQMSSFQDWGFFRSHNPEAEAQRRYAHTAFNH